MVWQNGGTFPVGGIYVCVPIRLRWGRSGGNECDSSFRRWENREGPEEIQQGSGVMRDSAPRSSDGMAPPSDGGPSEAESQNRRIPPTPVCRDEVGLTSPILPQVGEGPLEIESQFRWILPTPVGRDDVALTSPYFHSPVSVSVSSSVYALSLVGVLSSLPAGPNGAVARILSSFLEPPVFSTT